MRAVLGKERSISLCKKKTFWREFSCPRTSLTSYHGEMGLISYQKKRDFKSTKIKISVVSPPLIRKRNSLRLKKIEKFLALELAKEGKDMDKPLCFKVKESELLF